MTQKAKRTSERIREHLEQDILSGARPPGARLDEATLAQAFRVSRTPVREALQQLALSGLVELRIRRGAFVRQTSIREMVEMFEMMGELEALCARLAARRALPEQTAALKAALKKCVDAAAKNNTDVYYRANEAFHFAIYNSCGNLFLARQTQILHARLRPYRRLQLRVRGRVQQSLAEHRQIAKAIFAGNADEAARATKEHILIQGEKFNDLVANMDAAAASAKSA